MREKNILNFNWLDETTFAQWKSKYSVMMKKMQMALEDKLQGSMRIDESDQVVL